MNADALFVTFTSTEVANFIRSAERSVCYAGPGIQWKVAEAMSEAAKRLGPEMLTVCLDFDERVMRMGYGEIRAVEQLRKDGILVRSAPGLRTALVIADKSGFIFTPTPLYLETEPEHHNAPNAIRMSTDQVSEALARLSPVAKVIALAQAKTLEEKKRIEALPVDVGSDQVSDAQFSQVRESLKEVPPVRFDLARQVRVFEPYLQYVELSLSGAAIQRRRLAIPPNIQKLGGSKELEGRLRTTFDLIEKGGKLSSKSLEDALNEIRKNFTKSLGNHHGRVVLKARKQNLTERLADFRTKLEEHQKTVEAELQKHLDDSRKQVVEYYMARVRDNPPDALLGQLTSPKPTEDEARRWLDTELMRVFPKAESLIQKMRLEERYMDVTFETLNRDDFLESVKKVFPHVDWDKPYNRFKAVAESTRENSLMESRAPPLK